jgi:hypothetical protein
MTQYRYDHATGLPECQWNGPSWPFQTSQALTALANLLNDYAQTTVTPADYLRLLRQYTQQHYLSPGHPDIQEDYNPDTGRPIVGLPRSHHYSHSTYVDLILNGLIGIRPRADNILELNPLLPATTDSSAVPIHYFAVEGVRYHGHNLGVVYDDSGTRYGIGRGLSVFVDGARLYGPAPLSHTQIALPATDANASPAPTTMPEDLAANPGLPEGPLATASSSDSARTPSEAIDGRMWFFPENPNGWSPDHFTTSTSSWLAVDLRKSRKIVSAQLYFFADGDKFSAPRSYQLEYRTASGWQQIPGQVRTSTAPLGNGENRIVFPVVEAQQVRVVFTGPPAPAQFRLIEFELFAH